MGLSNALAISEPDATTLAKKLNQDRDLATIEPMMLYMGRRAREAAATLALASTEAKNAALLTMAERIEAAAPKILEANAQDLEAARAKGRDAAFLDRLALKESGVAAMASSTAFFASVEASASSRAASRARRPI